MRRLAPFCLILPFLLGGCTEMAIGALDEKVSEWTDKECSTVFIALGNGYCRDRLRAGERQSEKLHCFRTLGGVDCYAVSDPYGINASGRARQAQRLTEPVPQGTAAPATAQMTPDP